MKASIWMGGLSKSVPATIAATKIMKEMIDQ